MRTLTPLLAATLALSALFAPVAQAQTKKELVAKIVALQKPQFEQFGSMLANAPIQQLVQGASQVLRARVPEDKREATGKAMDAELAQYRKDVEPAMRASVLKHAPEAIGTKLEASFSEAELKQILGYLESPVIKRYVQLGPEMQNALAQRAASDNRALVEAKAKQLDARLADILGLKPAAAPASK